MVSPQSVRVSADAARDARDRARRLRIPSFRFVQLYGRKRVLLYPPAQHAALHVFPATHESYRQSQVPFEHEHGDAADDDADGGGGGGGGGARSAWKRPPVFARFAADAEAWEVVLEPGDVLYIPPYWFHRVEVGGRTARRARVVLEESYC